MSLAWGWNEPNPEREERLIERIASELALIDGYDPNEQVSPGGNQLTAAGWALMRDKYQARAERIVRLLKEEE
jgi:hypothetical protein